MYIKILNSKSLFAIFITLITFTFSNIINYQKKLTVFTVLFILCTFLIEKLKYEFKVEKFEKYFLSKLKVKYLFLLVCLILFLAFQNNLLNFETITWDVSSYLVASQEIEFGNLPFSKQWESKGPLNTLLFYVFSIVSDKNYLNFKILNDFFVFIILIFLFKYLQLKKSNNLLNYIAVVLLLTLFSTKWYVSEFTEFYCLFIFSLVQYFYFKYLNFKYIYFFIGIGFSISTLINQGSLIIIFGYIFYFFLNYKGTQLKKIFLHLFLGFTFPFVLMIFIYSLNGLLIILFVNYVLIPIGYSGENLSSIYEIRVFLRELFNYNSFLYFSIISIPLLIFKEYVLNKQVKIFILKDIDFILFFSGLAYYFIAGHNYYHHFIYFLYYLIVLLTKINFQNNKVFISILVCANLIYASVFYTENSLDNLFNRQKVYEAYPLRNLAFEIDSYFIDDSYSVFALDYVLVLYYLNKTNFSYIVHPTNHYQSYITKPLIKAGMLENNEVVSLFNRKPDVLICNTKAIDNGGEVINVDPINYGTKIEENQINTCSIEYLGKEYFLLETSDYRKNNNLSFYKDPYKEMNVFILQKYRSNK